MCHPPGCMCRGRLNCLIGPHSPPILVQELLFLFRNSYSRSGTQTTPPGRRTSKFYWWSWSDSDTLSRHTTSFDFTSNMLLLRFVVVVTSNTRLHHWIFLELDIGMPCYVGGPHQTYTIVQTAMGYCNIAILLVLPFTSSMLLRNRSISSTPNQ